jgi:cellulose biosynthesis protein BcsQ
MKITINNFPGGIGKTVISTELALTLDYQVITNDVYTPLSMILDKDSLLKLQPGQDMPSLPKDVDVIFDLGGYPDQRTIKALKMSDWVIVPTETETGRLAITKNYIKEIIEFNKNIILIASKAETGDLEIVKKVFKKDFPKIPVFEVKKSRALPNILVEKKSVHEMVKEGGLKGYHFQGIVKQFDAILNHIKNNLSLKNR